jgi:N-acetylglutamate synthase-like GNAT family acetyltransferase
VYLVEYTVRPAIREDIPAIRSLIHAVRINPTGLDWRRFLVAVARQGNLIGCGQIKLHADASWEMASIAVQEYARGQGVARAIIEALLALELERPLYLMCRTRLKRFYVKFGFHDIELEEMPLYFRRISCAERIFNWKARPDNRLLVMWIN